MTSFWVCIDGVKPLNDMLALEKLAEENLTEAHRRADALMAGVASAILHNYIQVARDVTPADTVAWPRFVRSYWRLLDKVHY